MPQNESDHAEPVPEVMTAKEVAAYLRVSYPTVLEMTKAGELPAIAVGREFRYLRTEIQRLMRNPARGATGPDPQPADTGS